LAGVVEVQWTSMMRVIGLEENSLFSSAAFEASHGSTSKIKDKDIIDPKLVVKSTYKT